MNTINENFRNNNLIKKMASEANWTFSTKEKMPVDMEVLLSKYYITGASFKDKNPLVTLDRIDAIPELVPLNRAYYFHAKDNHIMIIDIEKTASEETKKFFMQIPANYGEVSMSGKGIHLLIELDDKEIPEEARYIIESVSVLKLPSKDAEFIFNDHYCTFTKNQIPVIQKDNNNKLHNEIIRDLLMNLVKLDSKNKKIREERQKLTMHYEDNFDHTWLHETISDSVSEDKFGKTAEDYNYDESRWEMAYATFVLNKTMSLINKIKRSKKSVAKKDVANLTDSDIIYIAYEVLKMNLPHREKHDEERRGMPWLLYLTNNAFNYIKTTKK